MAANQGAYGLPPGRVGPCGNDGFAFVPGAWTISGTDETTTHSYSLSWIVPVGVPCGAGRITGIGIRCSDAGVMGTATYFGSQVGIYAPDGSYGLNPVSLLYKTFFDMTSTGYKTDTGFSVPVDPDWPFVWVGIGEDRDGSYTTMFGYGTTQASGGPWRGGVQVPMITFGSPSSTANMGLRVEGPRIADESNPMPARISDEGFHAPRLENYPYVPYVGIRFDL